MNELVEVVKVIGPTAGVLAIITWKLFDKINASDAFIKDRLTSVIEENTRAITRLDTRIKNRPCLIGEEDDSRERHTPLSSGHLSGH